jgi:hypothetical protein
MLGILDFLFTSLMLSSIIPAIPDFKHHIIIIKPVSISKMKKQYEIGLQWLMEGRIH